MAHVILQAPPTRPLPAQAHELIGRGQDLDRARTAVLQPDCRLLTVLGMAGVGKTRLALAVAESVEDRFAGGVCFVDLTRIDDAAALPFVVAMQLGLAVEDHSALQQVQEYLTDREMLLVLDNFEHVLPGALAVADILTRCRHVTVLATSREPLRLRWERRMVLGPLTVPEVDDLLPPDQLRAVPAVALFLQRASAVNLRFEATDEMLRQIAEICRRLEGMPLAIELAAARTSVLSPAALLARFEGLLPILHQHAADVPARHESIQAALEGSYGSLSPPDQTAFRRLSVFSGGWTVEAFEAVAAPALEHDAAFDMLATLSDKGLVTPVYGAAEESRFRLHEATCWYAAQMLEEARESADARADHARYYLGVAERATADLRYGGPFLFSPGTAASSAPWAAVLDHDLPNLHAALHWADDRDDAETLLRLAVALRRYWWVRGFLQEGTRWLRRALERNPNGPPMLRSRALSGLGILYRHQDDLARAQSLLEEAIALTRTLDDPRLLAAQLIDLGIVAGFQGRDAAANALVTESAELAQAGDDAWGRAVALSILGGADVLAGHGEAAEARLAHALVLFRAVGDERSVLVVDALLARAIGLQGDWERALPSLEESLRLSRRQLPEVMVGLVLDVAGSLLSKTAAPEACAKLLGAGDGARVRGLKRPILERAIYEEGLATVTATLDPQRLALMLEAGRALSTEAAIDEALALVQAAARLSPAASESPHAGKRPLSVREHEVLTLLAEGCESKAIGKRLGISPNTVKFHTNSIYTKLGVQGRVQAVAEAIRRGLV